MTTSEEKQLFTAVRTETERILGNAPGCHDFAHTLRVLHNAEEILSGETHTDFEAFAVRLAALLHDIGFAEGRRKHHKISMRRIETDTTLGIADKDRPLVALLARYHRKAWPSQKHRRFADLSGKKRDAICKAAALLRIADGLDYRHLGNIQDVSVEVTDSAIRLHAERQIDEILTKPVEFEALAEAVARLLSAEAPGR